MGAMQARGAGCHGKIAIQPLRSFLFAPGNHARRVEKALAAAIVRRYEEQFRWPRRRQTRRSPKLPPLL